MFSQKHEAIDKYIEVLKEFENNMNNVIHYDKYFRTLSRKNMEHVELVSNTTQYKEIAKKVNELFDDIKANGIEQKYRDRLANTSNNKEEYMAKKSIKKK